MRGLQGLTSAKATLKGAETFRAIRHGDFDRCETGVLNKIRVVRKLFMEGT